jgi:hypothetical protein
MNGNRVTGDFLTKKDAVQFLETNKGLEQVRHSAIGRLEAGATRIRCRGASCGGLGLGRFGYWLGCV